MFFQVPPHHRLRGEGFGGRVDRPASKQGWKTSKHFSQQDFPIMHTIREEEKICGDKSRFMIAVTLREGC